MVPFGDRMVVRYYSMLGRGRGEKEGDGMSALCFYSGVEFE